MERTHLLEPSLTPFAIIVLPNAINDYSRLEYSQRDCVIFGACNEFVESIVNRRVLQQRKRRVGFFTVTRMRCLIVSIKGVLRRRGGGRIEILDLQVGSDR